MSKIFGLFVILGALGEFAFCQQLIPVPYEHQDIDHPRTLFQSLFDNPGPIEARNDTPTTAVPTQDLSRILRGDLFDKGNGTPATVAPTVPSKPAPPTTEEMLFIPIYEEPIYDPNFYQIPPYHVLYNAPMQDPRLLLDSFEPGYPLMNGFPPIYPQAGVQPLPFFDQSLMKADHGSDRIIMQPIDSSPIYWPTNVNPSIGIQSLPYFNPVSINAATQKPILQIDGPKSLPRPTTAKPSISTISTYLFQTGNAKDIEMTDDDRNKLSVELGKLVEDFIMKKEQKMEDTFDNEQFDYKTLSPWSSTFVPPVTTSSVIPVVEDVIEGKEPSKQTDKLDVDQGNGSVSNSHLEVDQATPGSIGINQFDNTAASPNQTDDSRKLDTNDGEEDIDERGEFSAIATTDKSSTINSNKPLESNQTSANGSKLNDRFIDKNTSTFPKDVTVNGKNCTLGEEKDQDGSVSYWVILCPEESFDGKIERTITTSPSNVTFYTAELPTTSPKSTTPLFKDTVDYSTSVEYIDEDTLKEPRVPFDKYIKQYRKEPKTVWNKAERKRKPPCGRKKNTTYPPPPLM